MRMNSTFAGRISRVAVCALTSSIGSASFGCDDPLKRVDLVAEMRVLGARVEVQGAPERASPAPGEMATVRWLVADREPEPLLGWAFAICEAGPPGGSLPTCAGPPFATASANVPVPGEPRVDFMVPDDTESRALAIFGAVCPDSAPTFEGEAFGCEGPGGTLTSLDFELETPERSNLNPVIEPEALTLDGTALPAGLDCAALPLIAPGSSHALELVLDETDRDAVAQPTSADPPKETLQVSNFTTAGKLDRTFTVFQASDARLVTRVSWKAPKTAPDDGLVRLFFVVRDLRGGADWIERAVCMEP
jgi:hypothetical protein